MSTLISAVFSRPTSKIDLTFDNKVVVTFLSKEITFLKGIDQSQVEDIVIKNKGNTLYWPELNEEIKLVDLLAKLLGG